MNPTAWISSATFSDGTTLEFQKSDITVFVGPNNAGKSAALRELRSRFANSTNAGVVINKTDVAKKGSIAEVASWLQTNFHVNSELNDGDLMYEGFGARISHSRLGYGWDPEAAGYGISPHGQGIGEVAPFFCRHLTADARLSAANPAESIRLLKEPLRHPIHYMQKDSDIELKISGYFERAFSQELLVHRNAGSEVPLLVGKRPALAEGEDRLSTSYQAKLDTLPMLHQQGDGMRSFTGVLLYSLIVDSSVLLLDEPEAFLHPPQARLLGQMLARETRENRQLFIATHSGDILRGLLDSNAANVRVVRIQRDGNVNRINTLNNDDITQLWGDPLLRYSSVLDGVFHEHVVVCEGDADCRFYNAMMDSVFEAKGQDDRKPDTMFVHSGGKSRFPMLINALRASGVPVSAIADFDILNDEYPLRSTFESLGGSWRDIESLWRTVKNAIEEKKAPLSTQEVHDKIDAIFSSVNQRHLPKSAVKEIQQALSASSPWANAKKGGVSFVPSGQATKAFKQLAEMLEAKGLFVVKVGELEAFVRSASGHGPEWVNEVLQMDLAGDPELEAAKKFVSSIFLESSSSTALEVPASG